MLVGVNGGKKIQKKPQRLIFDIEKDNMNGEEITRKFSIHMLQKEEHHD